MRNRLKLKPRLRASFIDIFPIEIRPLKTINAAPPRWAWYICAKLTDALDVAVASADLPLLVRPEVDVLAMMKADIGIASGLITKLSALAILRWPKQIGQVKFPHDMSSFGILKCQHNFTNASVYVASDSASAKCEHPVA